MKKHNDEELEELLTEKYGENFAENWNADDPLVKEFLEEIAATGKTDCMQQLS